MKNLFKKVVLPQEIAIHRDHKPDLDSHVDSGILQNNKPVNAIDATINSGLIVQDIETDGFDCNFTTNQTGLNCNDHNPFHKSNLNSKLS